MKRPTPRPAFHHPVIDTVSRPGHGHTSSSGIGEYLAMATGTVKWFNTGKGYGFIAPDDGSRDAFVHISAVQRSGLETLLEGQRVSFELQPGQGGKLAAENLSIVE